MMNSKPLVSKPMRPRVSPENKADRQHRRIVMIARTAVSHAGVSSSSSKTYGDVVEIIVTQTHIQTEQRSSIVNDLVSTKQVL